MITDLRTSINSILYQRVTSPFFGTFLISWFVWNWKIFYITFIVESEKLEQNRIDYIVNNLDDPSNLIWYPILSTIILITIIPFISNGAYWISLKFEQWRIDNKHKIERKQLLTLEQSIQLREQLLDYEKKFETLLNEKDEEIKKLKLLIEKSSENNGTDENGNILIGSKEDKEERSAIEIFNRLRDSDVLKNSFYTISDSLQKGISDLTYNQNLDSKALSYFEANDVIQHNGQGNYKWTRKGQRIRQLVFDLDF
jgi:hypothetical protein